jgi:hypothetical protein
MTLMIRPQMGDRARQMHEFHSLGVVDSSGVFTDAEPEIVGTVATDFSITSAQVSKRDSFRVVVRMLADQAEGERALHAGEVNQLLVVPAGYLESGRLRRYALSTNIFSSQDERAVSSWCGAEPAARPHRPGARRARHQPGARAWSCSPPIPTIPACSSATTSAARWWTSSCLSRSDADGLCIVIGGQYLLQGVAEEKESRILESMALCTVNARSCSRASCSGLGSAGLTIVACWDHDGRVLRRPGAGARPGAPALAVLGLAIVYFLLG